MTAAFTPQEQKFIALWERHMELELEQSDAAATVATLPTNELIGPGRVPTLRL